MDREAAEPGDAVRLAPLLEPHHPGPLAVDLDDQPPEPLTARAPTARPPRRSPRGRETGAPLRYGSVSSPFSSSTSQSTSSVVGAPNPDRHAESSAINASSGS